MISDSEKKLTKLRSAVNNLSARRDKAEEIYKTAKFRFIGKKEDAVKLAARYKDTKALNEIRKESIDVLNSVSSLYEKFSIRKKIETILKKISECVFGQSNFSFRFIKKTIRNQQELGIFKVKVVDGQEFLFPICDVEGGGCDIIDIIIRVLLLKNLPEHQRTLILDEPMKNLSKDLRSDFFQFVKKICQEFKIQLLMVTHEAEYYEDLDKIFQFTYDGRTTTAEEI